MRKFHSIPYAATACGQSCRPYLTAWRLIHTLNFSSEATV